MVCLGRREKEGEERIVDVKVYGMYQILVYSSYLLFSSPLLYSPFMSLHPNIP
jgi:hypothetical protein